jgi:RNA polymerase sigma-70 factor, ECF subfamily
LPRLSVSVFNKNDAARNDEALMAAYQQGDLRAFATLVARHERPLWNYLRRFVKEATTAEDLLQETFMRVIKSAAGWKAQAKFTTWLYAIARNLCVDQARRAALRKAASLDGGARSPDGERESAPGLGEHLEAADRGAEVAVLSHELATRIDAAIDSLPVEQREVFLMREVLELPFAEIAAVLDENLGTVKSRMRYALLHLRRALAELRPSSLPASAGLPAGGPP